MNNEGFEKVAFKLLPVTLPILGLLILIAGYQQVAGFISDLGADTAFGKIRPTAIVDLKEGAIIRCLVGNLEKGDFERLTKVAEIKPREISLSKEGAISESLGFSAGPKELKAAGGERKHVWQAGERVLEISLDQRSINYSDFAPIGESKMNGPTLANKIAQDFLKKNELIFDLSISATNLVRIERGSVLETKEKPNGYKVIFSNRLDQYKIVTPRLEGLASVVVGVDGKIKRLAYLAPAEISKTSLYPTKGRDQAIKLLASGKAVISEMVFAGQGYLMGESYNIKTIKVDEMDLVYVDDGKNQYLQPHYQFRGEVSLADGRNGTITLFVNAIKDKYLKSE